LTIKQIHELTIKTWGRMANINKSIQEMMELIEELRDNKIGAKNQHNIIEEIADCRNMLDKLVVIYEIDDKEVHEIQRNKMVRTYKRLKG